MDEIVESINLKHFEILKKQGILHFITTRSGGVSSPPYESLNLGMHTLDAKEHVAENRNILAATVGISLADFIYAQQVHSGKVTIVTKNDIGSMARDFSPETDAMITNLKGICLMVMVADCVPILIYDPVKKVVAAVHAGWRGTVKKIVINTVEAMQNHFHCNSTDLLVGIGPSSGPCCYEVGEDVKQEVEKAFGSTIGVMSDMKSNSKYHFDLWQANKNQLLGCGVKETNIEVSALCTQCNSEIFFSSRASGGVTGRFAAGISLLKLL